MMNQCRRPVSLMVPWATPWPLPTGFLLLRVCLGLSLMFTGQAAWGGTTEQLTPHKAATTVVEAEAEIETDVATADQFVGVGLPNWESWTSPERVVGSLRVVAVMAALSLAPAFLLMTTCYVRIIVVLSLFRQALGNQQLPPNQVTTALALFLTLLIMTPVWLRVQQQAIEPYTDPETEMSFDDAWQAGIAPVRDFMSGQISRYNNHADVRLFLKYLPESETPPATYADVPLQALLPAFLLSELKVAFLIGFRVYLPFVVVDLVVATVTTAMGMMMVPPSSISMPLKLLLFVLVDGWHLVVEMLLMSFQA